MEIYTSYKIKVRGFNDVLADTVRIYCDAVNWYISLCLEQWDKVSSLAGAKKRLSFVESLSVLTKKNTSVIRDFCAAFYKFPSYLRRAAINEAIGKVSSYKSNLANWEAASPSERNKRPSIPKAGRTFPAMYKGNCYVRIDDYTAKIKVFIHNTWDWVTVTFRKSDADYILRHCAGRKECVPTLRKRRRAWFLDFSFEENVSLPERDIFHTTVLAVDLGIGSACTCSVMRSDGTVIGRRFLRLPKENDCLTRKTNRIRAAQSLGSRGCCRLWSLAKGAADDIAVKTASFIMDTAVLYNADVIVFEHLDFGGKKRGSRKMRLHLWKARYVQSMVTDKAHRLGMRVSRVNAWNTSRLAFDGSGRVKRGQESEKTAGCYSVCEFTTGKVYNCDLNASYNIGARYFIREIIKSLPARERQRMEAKVPSCVKRSTCTLSTLISLNTGLHAAA